MKKKLLKSSMLAILGLSSIATSGCEWKITIDKSETESNQDEETSKKDEESVSIDYDKMLETTTQRFYTTVNTQQDLQWQILGYSGENLVSEIYMDHGKEVNKFKAEDENYYKYVKGKTIYNETENGDPYNTEISKSYATEDLEFIQMAKYVVQYAYSSAGSELGPFIGTIKNTEYSKLEEGKVKVISTYGHSNGLEYSYEIVFDENWIYSFYYEQFDMKFIYKTGIEGIYFPENFDAWDSLPVINRE